MALEALAKLILVSTISKYQDHEYIYKKYLAPNNLPTLTLVILAQHLHHAIYLTNLKH